MEWNWEGRSLYNVAGFCKYIKTNLLVVLKEEGPRYNRDYNNDAIKRVNMVPLFGMSKDKEHMVRTRSSNGGVNTCFSCPPIFLFSFGKWQFIGQFLRKRKPSTCIQPLPMNPNISHTPCQSIKKDGIMTAHSMTQDVGSTLQAILAKLEKLNSVEWAMKNIEANLRERLDNFQTKANCGDNLLRNHSFWFIKLRLTQNKIHQRVWQNWTTIIVFIKLPD